MLRPFADLRTNAQIGYIIVKYILLYMWSAVPLPGAPLFKHKELSVHKNCTQIRKFAIGRIDILTLAPGHDVLVPPVFLRAADEGAGNGARGRIPASLPRGQKHSRLHHSARRPAYRGQNLEVYLHGTRFSYVQNSPTQFRLNPIWLDVVARLGAT
jgi:hypothetical protein